MCALAALANCAKADIVSAQEQFDVEADVKGILINNDQTAAIGSVKTPWMIVRPDGKSAFANDFTTNAISVVSEDGVNYYAHVEGENGDRTKVIHFTVHENGIPSKQGNVIDLLTTGEITQEDMKDKKLVGVLNKQLFFYPTDKYGTSMIYDCKTGDVRTDIVRNKQTDSFEAENQKCLASFSNCFNLFMLCNAQRTDYNGNITTNAYFKAASAEGEYISSAFSSDIKNMVEWWGDVYTGDSNGNVRKSDGIIAILPGPISGLSHNYKEVFATTPATNAFYNATLGQYNVVKDDNGNPKPMVPKTNDGLIKVIDNRRNGGKFLCVTTKGIHSIDD